MTAPRFLPILALTGALLVVSLLLAPTSVEGQQLSNTLFFASFLGIGALGQHLVILIGGIDLSIGPIIGLSAIVFADIAQSEQWSEIMRGAVVALAIAAAVGLANGVAVTVLRITPLVATLGVGALATGLAFTFIGEGAPDTISEPVRRFVTNRSILDTFSPVTIVWLALAAIVTATLSWTVLGRSFTAVGSNPGAARLLGMRVDAYRIAAYLFAALLYGILGLALTGLAGQPSATFGESYLLPSIAAVVVGGTLLGGGAGSIAATSIGAFFITQLDSLTFSLKAPTGVQLMVQAGVIAFAMALYAWRPGWRLFRSFRPKEALST